MKRQRIFRLLVLLMLIAFIAFMFHAFLSNPQTRAILHGKHAGRNLVHHYEDSVRHFSADHPVLAPISLVAGYVLMTLAILPTWWIAVLAGVAFGLIRGIIYVQIAASLAAAATVLLAHWLAGEWIHKKIEARRARLRKLDEMLGNNGLLVVMAVRLTHVMPFALSNYFFGLTRIEVRDAFFGTLLGGIPTTAFYLSITTHTNRDWRFWTVVLSINFLLLVPVVWRWWRQHRTQRRVH